MRIRNHMLDFNVSINYENTAKHMKYCKQIAQNMSQDRVKVMKNMRISQNDKCSAGWQRKISQCLFKSLKIKINFSKCELLELLNKRNVINTVDNRPNV
jgi:hypothetical protein